jgi:hypothetical protein
MKVGRIAGKKNVGFEAADSHNPAELPNQITILFEYLPQCLPVGKMDRFGAARRLSEFFFHG